MSNCTANNTHGTTTGPTTGPVGNTGYNPAYATSNFWPNGYFYGPTATTPNFGHTVDPTGQFFPTFTPQYGVQNATPWVGQAWNGFGSCVPTGGYQGGFNTPTFFNPYTAFNGFTPTFGYNPFVNTTGYTNTFSGQPVGYTQGYWPFAWQTPAQFYGQFNGQYVPQSYGYQNYGYPTGGYQGGFNTFAYNTPTFNNCFTPFNTGWNTAVNTTPWNVPTFNTGWNMPVNTTPWGVPTFNTGWNTQGTTGQPWFTQTAFNQTGYTQPGFGGQFFQGGFNPFYGAWQNGFTGFGYNAQTNTQFANQFVNQQQAEANFRRNIGLCRDAA